MGRRCNGYKPRSTRRDCASSPLLETHSAGAFKRSWKNKFQFPVYFDDKAYRNQLAMAMGGVRSWPLVLLFDCEAKLRAVAQRPGDEEFVRALRQQFPDVPEQTLVDALMGPPEPTP